MNYLTGLVSDAGIEKSTNQDSALIKVGTVDDKTVVLAAVCDGMGGLEKGELASAHVIRSFSDWYEDYIADIVREDDFWNLARENCREHIKRLNDELNDYAGKIRTNLGTTITAVLMMDGHYLCVNVGDSRTYKISGSMSQITEDQSLIMREIKMGRLKKEDAVADPRRNVLLQCIGATQNVDPVFYEGDAVSGEAFLLCSDGFAHEVSEEEMYERFIPEQLNSDEVIEDRIRKLVELNKQRQERDNITAMIIRLV